jgi:uncharacterized protein (TIGR00369 family)
MNNTSDQSVHPLIEKIRATKPAIAELIGFEAAEVGDGRAVMWLQTGPQHANPMGTLHGGILCALADAAMGLAFVSTLAPDESFTTIALNINFFVLSGTRAFALTRASSTGARTSAMSNATPPTRTAGTSPRRRRRAPCVDGDAHRRPGRRAARRAQQCHRESAADAPRTRSARRQRDVPQSSAFDRQSAGDRSSERPVPANCAAASFRARRLSRHETRGASIAIMS